MMRKLSALVGIVGLLACLSACGVSVGPRHTLSGPSVAHEISQQLAKDYPVEAPAVSCPDGIEARKGTTFVCTTVLDGQHLDMDGTVTGSDGRYQVIPRDAVIPISSLTRYLSDDIKTQTGYRPSKIDCGPRTVAVVAVGAKIICSASFPRVPQPRTITSIVTDRDGKVTYTMD
jgi:hypothetical protein